MDAADLAVFAIAVVAIGTATLVIYRQKMIEMSRPRSEAAPIDEGADRPVWHADGVLTPTFLPFDYGGLWRVTAVLVPETVAWSEGVPASAVVGVFTVPIDERKPLPLDDFEPNPQFAELYHRVVAGQGPDSPALQAEATALGEGRLYITGGPLVVTVGVMPTDQVIGSFEVADGTLVRGSYEPNMEYRFLLRPGVVWIDPYLVGPLRMAIAAAAR